MKIALAVVGGLVVVLAALLGWMGALAGVRIQEQDRGPYAFVYVQHATADRSQVDALTQTLGERLEDAGFTQRQPAQIYYPMDRGVQNQIGFVVDRTVPFEVLGADAFFRPVPVQRYVVARFPYRNALSFVVGDFRVGPALKAYRRQKNYGETLLMVVHEGDSLLYLQPVATGG